MPHVRVRHLKKLLTKTLKFSTVTGIFGHRQVGKTTLAGELADKYVTLDNPVDLSESSANPEGFLAQRQALPLVIDECQLSPRLFPALKEWERSQKRPGQFLLTGSVRFSSRKAIRESLTGRLIAWELLPLDWAEIHELELSNSIHSLLTCKNIETAIQAPSQFNQKNYERYIIFGGLPGIFGLREASIISQKFETQINTILERDLRLLIQTTLDFKTLRRILVSLAKCHGKTFEIANLNRETRVSQPTLRKLIAAFESLFLIRFIPTEGAFTKPVIFFEDLGERNHLVSQPLTTEDSVTAFLYQNLRTQIFYRPENKIELFNFKSGSGFDVPLCFRQHDKVIGIIPIANEDSFLLQFETAQKFLKIYSNAKVFLVGRGIRQKLLAPKILMTDVSALV